MSNKPWDTALLPEPDLTPGRTVHHIFSSDGTCLQFHTAVELAKYEREHEDVIMQAYHVQRTNYGIWADHQGKYVKTREELTRWDGDIMERRYDAWLARGCSNG